MSDDAPVCPVCEKATCPICLAIHYVTDARPLMLQLERLNATPLRGHLNMADAYSRVAMSMLTSLEHLSGMRGELCSAHALPPFGPQPDTMVQA